MSNEVYIGTPNSPLPYVDENGVLRLLADDFTYIKLPTNYNGDEKKIQERIFGMMWRGLPTRGRLNSFLKNLRRRSNNLDADLNLSQTFNNRRRANLTLGMPGSGKTYQAKLLGRMSALEGAFYVNCKDLDLKNLVVKTVLDTSNIDVEKNAIDARIKMYNKGDKNALSDEGVNLLKTMFESAFSADEDGRIALDWSAARNDTKYTSQDRDKEFVSLLQQFCKRENIDYSHNLNSVGFVEKDGPLIEALESGRQIILDEINRGKNQDYLLPYLDFLNGGYESMDIEAANGRVIHLTKDNMKPTFMLEAIGNPETLEMGIKEKMSEPLKDRFDIENVEDYTPKDFTDMFCTHVAGVPISIIKDAFNIKNDRELSQVCMTIRTMGLTDEEYRAFSSSDQKTYIENAAQFLEAAECVGKALYELYEYKKACANSSVCEDAKLRSHIKGQTFSYRIIEDIVNRAKTYIPESNTALKTNPFLNYSPEKPKGKNTMEMRLERQGEGLEAALKQVVKEMFFTSEADKKLAEPVLGYANGILAKNGVGDEVYMEARPITQGRLKNMFTFNSKKRASEEALNIQEIICRLVKDQHPEKASQTNDEIMDALAIEGFLANIRENPEEKHPVIGKILSVNSEEKTNNQTPFIENSVVQTLGFTEEIPTEKLVDVDDFLATLVIDGVAENNLNTIWSGMMKINQKENEGNTNDEILNITSGESKEVNYGAFAFKDNGNKRLILDIIHLPKENKTLIIGEGISKVTSVRLKSKQIKYVDRNEDNSEKTIRDWVSQIEDNNTISSLLKAIKQVNNVVSSSAKIGKELTKSFEERDVTNVSQVSAHSVNDVSKKVNRNQSRENLFQVWQNISEIGSK